ncbi:MAG: hypothetical protein AVDCRST_MAG03-3229, partial [uncultured Rubrobacteraceae bacterium]
ETALAALSRVYRDLHNPDDDSLPVGVAGL